MNIVRAYNHLVDAALQLTSQRRAVTSIEYGLIAALIAVVIIGSAGALGHGVSNTFGRVAGEL